MPNLGTSPPINRLIVIPHNTQVSMALCQGLDDPILTPIGVLILVDQYMVITARFGQPDLGILYQQLLGKHQQVIEIKCRLQLQSPLVTPKSTRCDMLLVARGRTVGILRPNPRILPPTDNTQKIRRR